VRRWLVVAWIGLLLTTLGCQPAPVRAQAPPEEKVDLHREIQLLNLINGLELTPEQMRFILEKAVDARATRAALKAEGDAPQLEAILQEIRDALMAGLHVSGKLEDAFFVARGANKQLVEAYERKSCVSPRRLRRSWKATSSMPWSSTRPAPSLPSASPASVRLGMERPWPYLRGYAPSQQTSMSCIRRGSPAAS